MKPFYFYTLLALSGFCQLGAQGNEDDKTISPLDPEQGESGKNNVSFYDREKVDGGDGDGIVDQPINNINNNPDVGKNNDNINDNNNVPGNVRCMKCSKTETDSGAVTYYDNYRQAPVQACDLQTESSCSPAEDWCLVSKYNMLASGNAPEREVTTWHCGSEVTKMSFCNQLEAKDHDNIIYDCETKRSGATSLISSLVWPFVVAPALRHLL